MRRAGVALVLMVLLPLAGCSGTSDDTGSPAAQNRGGSAAPGGVGSGESGGAAPPPAPGPAVNKTRVCEDFRAAAKTVQTEYDAAASGQKAAVAKDWSARFTSLAKQATDAALSKKLAAVAKEVGTWRDAKADIDAYNNLVKKACG